MDFARYPRVPLRGRQLSRARERGLPVVPSDDREAESSIPGPRSDRFAGAIESSLNG